MHPESSLPQNTHMDECGPLKASQTPLLRESLPASKSNSPAASLPDSLETSQPVVTQESGPPASPSGWMPINKPYLLRKAVFAGSASDPEDAQATTTSVDTQFVHGTDLPAASPTSLSPHAHPESTSAATSLTTYALSQPTQQAPAQQSVSPPAETSSTSPTTSNSSSKLPTVKRQSFSSAKFELLAKLDKKSWIKKTAQPVAASQEQGPEKKKDDDSDERGEDVSSALTYLTMKSLSPIHNARPSTVYPLLLPLKGIPLALPFLLLKDILKPAQTQIQRLR